MLTPTYVSPTTLTATVPASAIANTGIVYVSYETMSNPFELQVIAPGANPPTLSPSSAVAGGPGFTLTYTAPSPLSDYVLQWNGEMLATTQVSPTVMTAEIPASAIATAGTAMIYVSYEVSTEPPIPSAGFEFPILAAGSISTPGSTAVQANLPSPSLNLTLPTGVRKHWDRLISRD